MNHFGLQIVLGARDPENLPHRQIGQMAEVDVSLVEYDDFPGLDSGAHCAGALGIGVPGGVHDGKARQEALQIQAQVTFGRRLAPPMSGPIQAGRDQRNRGRIDQVNRTLKLAGKSLARFAADKARRQIAQVLEDRPEELLRHLGRAYFVGVREIVARGRRGSPDARQRSRMQSERITDVVESNAMDELRVEQRDGMAPRTKGSGLLRHLGITRDLGDQELGNEVANLPQQIQF